MLSRDIRNGTTGTVGSLGQTPLPGGVVVDPNRFIISHRKFANSMLYADRNWIWINVYECLLDSDNKQKRESVSRRTFEEIPEKAKIQMARDRSAWDQEQTKAAPQSKVRTHYTYISLEIGRPSIKSSFPGNGGKYGRLAKCHHITLAYLPTTTMAEREQIRKALEDIIKDFFSTAKNSRPCELLSSRYFEVPVWAYREARSQSDQSWYGLYEGAGLHPNDLITGSFLGCHSKHLEYYIRKGVIKFCSDPQAIREYKESGCPLPVPEQLMRNVCDQYVSREQERVRDAAIIEMHGQAMGESDAYVEIKLENSVVSPYSEIFPLLYYLQQTLIFRFAAYYRHPIERVGLLGPASWHVTSQTRGICARRSGKDVPKSPDSLDIYLIPNSF